MIKEFINKNRTLIKNFSSLSVLQLSQYIFPLITFPYLVRVLSPEGYGLVAFATAFVSYFSMLTDYGFNLSATKEISINRNNSIIVSEIFNSVLTVKILLFILSIIIIIPIVFLFPKFNRDSSIYLISFVSVLGTTLFPVWFFQGIERMSFISIISIAIKIIWVVLIFFLIKSYDDILLLVTLNSLSSVLTGLFGLISVRKYFNLNFSIPTLHQIKYQFIEGWHYFLSTASISLYTISNIFILGLFASDTIVGYYSAADKIRYAIQNISSVASRTVFPHLSSEFKRSEEAAFGFISKYIKSVGGFSVLSSILLFIFAEQITVLVLGKQYMESVIILKIISFLPLIIFFSNVAGVQTMLNMGFKREFANIILGAGIFNILLSFIIVPIYFSIGTAVAVVLTEIIVSTQMVYFLRKNNIRVFKKLKNEI